MLYILIGEDDFSLAQSLDEIKRELGDQASLASNTTTLDGQQVALDNLKIVCETVPFLSGRRLIITEGLLQRFETKGRTSRRRKTSTGRSNSGAISSGSQPYPFGESKQQDQYKLFGSYIPRIPDSTVLVLVERKVAGANPLFNELADKAIVKFFRLLRGARLRQWVKERVKEEGGSISLQAVDLLAKLVGSNLWIMTSEISKLVLFASGRRIEEEDVKMVVSYAQQDSVFAMVDAIMEFRFEVAGQLLEQLLQRGALPAYLLTMLSRQSRMIFRAQELRNQRKSTKEIQNKLGLSSEFVLSKTLEQANRYSLPRLKEVYHELLAADLSIKTGKYSGELALYILVAELCQQGKACAVHSGFGSAET